LCWKVILLLICRMDVVINVERHLGTVKIRDLHHDSVVPVQHNDNVVASYMTSSGSARKHAPCNLEKDAGFRHRSELAAGLRLEGWSAKASLVQHEISVSLPRFSPDVY